MRSPWGAGGAGGEPDRGRRVRGAGPAGPAPAAALAVVAGAPASLAAAAAPTPVTVYKDPNCGCCAKWVDHMGAAGFRTTVKDTADMDAVKKRLGVPATLQSCHT